MSNFELDLESGTIQYLPTGLKQPDMSHNGLQSRCRHFYLDLDSGTKVQCEPLFSCTLYILSLIIRFVSFFKRMPLNKIYIVWTWGDSDVIPSTSLSWNVGGTQYCSNVTSKIFDCWYILRISMEYEWTRSLFTRNIPPPWRCGFMLSFLTHCALCILQKLDTVLYITAYEPVL